MAAASYQTINSQCSNLELKLTSLINELKQPISFDTEGMKKLTKDVRDTFVQLRAKIQMLQVSSRETKTSDEKDEIHKMVEWHNTQLKEMERSHQRANLVLKRKQDDLNRASLLAASSGDEEQVLRKRKNHGDSVQASSAVTDSLVELRQKLATGLTLSEDTMKTLVNSSSVLNDSKNEMVTVGSHIDMSTRLISKFGRREVVDKLLIMAGIILFFSVVLYILKKRLIG